MSRLIFALLLAGSAAAASAANTYFELIEYAAEVERLELATSPVQLLYARRCDESPMLALSVGPDSQVFDGKSRITLAAAARFTNRGGTVLFEPQTRRVTRIIFWPETRTTP